MRVSGLRSRELFSGNAPAVEGDCRIAPPEDSSCNTCCPTACCPDPCPPKVRLKDYLRIKPFIQATEIALAYEHCDPQMLMGWQTCITGQLRHRGKCEVMSTVKPVSASLDGKVKFDWNSIDIWKHGNGDFEMDLMIKTSRGHYCCMTIGIRLIGCHIFMASYNHMQQEPCAPTSCATNDCAVDCTVPLDTDDTVASTENTCAEC